MCVTGVYLVLFFGCLDGLVYPNEVNITEIYEPVTKLCEAFGFETSSTKSARPEGENIRYSPDIISKVKLQPGIRLLKWRWETDLGHHSLTISYTAPSYHDVMWEWRNRHEPYQGFIPIVDGDPLFTSTRVYVDWFYQITLNTSLPLEQLAHPTTRIHLIITTGDQQLALTPFMSQTFGEGYFDEMEFNLYEIEENGDFRILNAELIDIQGSAYRFGVYAYFDWIQKTLSSDGTAVFTQESVLLKRTHFSDTQLGSMENYTYTNNSVRADIYLANSLAENGGILRVITWAMWKSNDIPYKYSYYIPVNGGYSSESNACSKMLAPRPSPPELLKGTTHTVECTCFGNPPPNIRILKEGSNSNQYPLRKVSVGFENTVILVLRNMSIDMAGNYTCYGVSKTGAVLSETSITLQYGEPATFVPNSTVVRHLENNQVSVTFMVTGVPRPTISHCMYYNRSWHHGEGIPSEFSKHRGYEVPSNSTEVESVDNNVLSLRLIVPGNITGTIVCEYMRSDHHQASNNKQHLFIEMESGVDDKIQISFN